MKKCDENENGMSVLVLFKIVGVCHSETWNGKISV